MAFVESFRREPIVFVVLLSLFLCSASITMSMGFKLLAISEVTGYSSRVVQQLWLSKAACESAKKASEVCRVSFIAEPVK